EFHHAFAGVLHHWRIGFDHHIASTWQCARCLWLRWPRRYFHQTHTAIAGDGQALMVAKAWDFDAKLVCSLNDHRTRFDLDFLSVNSKLRHYCLCCLADSLMISKIFSLSESNDSLASLLKRTAFGLAFLLRFLVSSLLRPLRTNSISPQRKAV